jgi:DNA-binding NtrC family response regulator
VRLLQEHAGGQPPPVEPKLVEQLCLYDWPFNVREMDLLVRSLLVMHDGHGPLKRAHLPARFRAPSAPAAQPAPAPTPTSASTSTPTPASARRRGTEEERRARDERDLAALVAALRVHAGNVVRAAAAVGVSRQRAYRLMELGSDVDLHEIRGEGREAAAEPGSPRGDGDGGDGDEDA